MFSWTTIALIAIVAVVVMFVLYLIFAVIAAAFFGKQWKKMSDDFEKKWDEFK